MTRSSQTMSERSGRAAGRAGAACICAWVAVAGDASGQGTDWMAQLSGAGTLQGIHFPADTTTGFACGSAGLLLKTTDGGRTWAASSPAAADLTCVWFRPDETTGWLTTADGSILRTTDGGATWSTAAVSPQRLDGVHFPAGSIGYAVGAAGAIYKSLDAGATWFALPSPTAVDLHAVHFPVSDHTGWAVGDDGTIVKLSGGSVITGTYGGDGAGGRPIEGLGFAPEVVIVKGDLAEPAVIRTASMAGDSSKLLGSATALQASRIQSLDADGFTLGADPDVNQVGATYSYAAFDAAPGVLAVGSYVGDGTNNRAVNGVGFQPDYVIVFGSGATQAWQKPSALSGNQSLPFGAAAKDPQKIKSLEPDGFKVANDADVNAAGVTYHYAAWKAIAGSMAVGSYLGDGDDDRSIGGVGFQPRYLIVKADAAHGGRHRPEILAGESSQSFLATANDADRIQALQGDGFQVGAADEVNSNGMSCYWVAFGGADWTVQNPTTSHLRGLHMVDETTGYVCGEGDTILRTADGGATWTPRPTGAGGAHHVYAVRFPAGASAGACAGSGGRIFATIDGGATWSEQTTPTSQDLRAAWFPQGAAIGWAAGGLRTIVRSRIPRVVTGAYTGNGQDDRGITGVGFAPDLLIIAGDGQYPVARTTTMAGDAARRLDDGSGLDAQPNRIQSLDSDGFTIGTDPLVNADGVSYRWAALEARGEFQVGTYSGDGDDDRVVTGVGFRPDYVMVMASQDVVAVQRYAGQSGDSSLSFGAAGPSTDRIQAFLPDGFQVGADSVVNRNGWEYHWVAVKELGLSIDVGSHGGDGFDDRSISAPGFRPEYMILKAHAAEVGVHRFDSLGAVDASLEFAASGVLLNRIQRFEDTGFQLGDHATVNEAGTIYYWTAFVVDPASAWQAPRIVRWSEVDPR